MQYVISFLEGVVTFISPCLLPMLPIYISYFAGGGERSVKKTLSGALGFVTGFTIVFVVLGALAGTLGSLLKEYQTAVNIVSGLIVVFFGLNFLGVFKLNLFKGSNHKVNTKNMGFFSAILFGQLDALRRCVFRLGADARFTAGACRRGGRDAPGLFAGARHSVRAQRGAD